MGTPEFAAVILRRLLQRPDLVNVAAVVTQPDQAVGRGRRVVPLPVKLQAEAAGIEVIQPPSVRRGRFAERLQHLGPDLLIVAAYGRILPPEILAISPHGALNVHASLLPRYRGASPISAAILAGEDLTGVSVMLMNEAMDAGPLLASAKRTISPNDTTESLTKALSELGAELLVTILPRWLDGALMPEPQDNAQANYCRPLRRDDGRIDWRVHAVHLARQVRAMFPWPGTYTYWGKRQLKVLAAHAEDSGPAVPDGHVPGTVVEEKSGLAIVCGEGMLVIDRLQLEGKRGMDSSDFLRGQRSIVGTQLSVRGS